MGIKFFNKLKWEPSMLKYVLVISFFIIIVIFNTLLLFSSSKVTEKDDKLINKLTGNSMIDKPAISLILMSFITYLSILIGFFGFLNKKSTALILFCLLLLTINTIEALCIYFGFNYNSKLSRSTFSSNLIKLFLNYNWNSNSSNINSTDDQLIIDFDQIHLKFKCCGYNNYSDWDMRRPNNIPSNSYPLSCCHQFNVNHANSNNLNGNHSTDNSTDKLCHERQINSTLGCNTVIGNQLIRIVNRVTLMVASAICLLVVQLFAIPIVCYFITQVKHEQQSLNYGLAHAHGSASMTQHQESNL